MYLVYTIGKFLFSTTTSIVVSSLQFDGYMQCLSLDFVKLHIISECIPIQKWFEISKMVIFAHQKQSYPNNMTMMGAIAEAVVGAVGIPDKLMMIVTLCRYMIYFSAHRFG